MIFRGSRFVSRMARLSEGHDRPLHSATQDVILREVARRGRERANAHSATQSLKQAARRALRWARSKDHYRDYINVTAREHMSSVDCFDGKEVRSGDSAGVVHLADEDLITIHPIVDGRLKDSGRDE